MRLLKEDLDRRGIAFLSGELPKKDRIESGGRSFSRGALYALLSNPIYVGEIRHKGVCHPGQHEAILDRTVWDRTQQQLREHRVRGKSRGTRVEKSPLIGRLVDENGDGLTPSHARKRERKYRYYVSRNLKLRDPAPSRVGWRLPARELEQRAAAAVREMLDDQTAVLEAAHKTDIDSPPDRPGTPRSTHLESRFFNQEIEKAAALTPLVDQVELKCHGIGVSIKLPIADTEKVWGLAAFQRGGDHAIRFQCS